MRPLTCCETYLGPPRRPLACCDRHLGLDVGFLTCDGGTRIPMDDALGLLRGENGSLWKHVSNIKAN